MTTERVALPVNQVPEGDGWEMVTGNLLLNLWERKPKPTVFLTDKYGRIYPMRGRTPRYRQCHTGDKPIRAANA